MTENLQIFMMKAMIDIGVDIRGLNDPHFTGVNTYIMHSLWELHSQKPPHWTITGIGLKEDRKAYLWKRFPFLAELFDSTLTLQEYFKIPLPNKALQFISLWIPNYNKIHDFDILYLPQPRALTSHPHTKVIVTFHDVYYAFNPDAGGFSTLAKRLIDNPASYKRLANRVDRVFAVSLSTSLDIERKLEVQKSRISWVYPGFPHWSFDTSASEKTKTISEPPKPYALAISGWEWRKNWLNVILAHKKAQSNPAYKLHMVFTGFPSQKKFGSYIHHCIRKYSIKNVHFIDSPSHSQKLSLMKKAQGTVYPSWYEGFGFPILESFSQRTPVMYGIYGSGFEVAGKGGIPVNPGIVDELAFGLTQFSENTAAYKELREHARISPDQYSWSEWYLQFKKTIIALTKDH